MPAVETHSSSSLAPAFADSAISVSLGKAQVTSDTVVLASGRLHMQAIHLPAGARLSKISFLRGGTGGVITNAAGAIFNESRALQVRTLDATLWVSDYLSLGLDDGGTQFVVPYSGIYYVGLVVTASVVPSLCGGATIQTNVSTLSPAFVGTSNTGLTNAASIPSTAAAITATTVPILAVVS